VLAVIDHNVAVELPIANIASLQVDELRTLIVLSRASGVVVD
jgi:hypothetical protein